MRRPFIISGALAALGGIATLIVALADKAGAENGFTEEETEVEEVEATEAETVEEE
jgi:hypothetical protein